MEQILIELKFQKQQRHFRANNSAKFQDKNVNTKWVSFLYTRQSKKEFKGKKFIYDTIRAKYLRMNLTKETKTLLKERKDLNK